MKNRKKMMLVTLVGAVILAAAVLTSALSPLTSAVNAPAATSTINVEPPVEGCSSLGVTDIKNENVGLVKATLLADYA